MADKAITELVAAEDITASDLFVLQQNDTAKKLPGQVLLNWLTKAADGHGGIKSISKLSTSGLADTYRITLADTTIFDFVVTNGKGISKIVKTKTSGLVDTYTITFNDSSTSTFTVTNGDKGDKGDNAYIWIKYASKKPTSSSVSLGDVPDEWIGIYTGTSPTAPTSYSSYKWYQIKGEKGDTGDPATLTSSTVSYQVGDSGTVMPSGSWSSNPPVVPQGKFLWTRMVIQFNTGSPVTSYSVARMGVDGSGSVSSVNNIGPDGNGNIEVTADDLGALSKKGGTMEGEINMNGQALTGLNEPKSANEPATKAYVDNIDWFGPGEGLAATADLNTITKAGKYFAGNDSTAEAIFNNGHGPTKSNYVLYVFDRTGYGTVTQLAITLTGRMYLRGKSSSSWRDWVEFARRSDISKDMMPGTEYTTLEQYKGETVYAKLVSQTYTSNIGVVGAPVDYAINHGISNLKEVIRWTGSDGTYTYPYFNADGGIITVKAVDSSEIIIRAINAVREATADSPLTISIILYYTKKS